MSAAAVPAGATTSLVPMACTVTIDCGTPTPTPTSTPTPSPSDSIPGVSIGTDGWITYTDPQASSLGITNSLVTTVQGTVDPDGGCEFVDTSEDATSDVSYQEEVGYNPTTCQDRILTGNITASAEATIATPLDSTDTTDSSQTVGAGATPDANGAIYQSAHAKVAWIDPLNVTITSLTANLKWPISAGTLGTITARNNAYKFAYDGWTTSGTPVPGIVATSTNGGGWITGGAETFKNTDFENFIIDILGPTGWASCGFTSATAIFKHHVDVYGYENGERGASHTDSKSGGCSNLVHHRTSNGYGWTS